MKKTILIILTVVVLLFAMVVIYAINTSNHEIDLRTTATAQQKNTEAYFDKMWKIISQDNQAAEKYKNAFKEVYVPLIEGRYSQKDANGKYISGDGSLMKLVMESNPNFTPELYQKLMSAIEGQREGFFVEQQKLIDIEREHTALRLKFPSSWIVGGRPALKITVITSEKTEQVFKIGQENDITL